LEIVPRSLEPAVQNIVVEKPYRFVPPHPGTIWPRLLAWYVHGRLDRDGGIVDVECRGLERLRASLRDGHGILVASNHCRPCDPMVLNELPLRLGQPFHVMASWHLFTEGRLRAFLLRRAGAFSIYREGLDKSAIDAAIRILETASRPLVIFPEGVISRTNDRLNPLMEGTALIARTAARRRAAASPPGRVVVHPVAIRYRFGGDLEAALDPVLTGIEARLTWLPQRGRPLLERVERIGLALLGLKEIEHLGRTQDGSIPERLGRLIDQALAPIEREWLPEPGAGSAVARVKRLRAAILPDLVKGELPDAERERRWRQLTVLYYAQQMSFYPPDYVAPGSPPEHLLETVERFEEDLTDTARIHRPMTAVIEIGPALEVPPVRERGGSGDPLMQKVEEQMRDLLARGARPAESTEGTEDTETTQ
jgi:1-acyl-sn-glycerol-3-phosphate acyltransferase